VAAESSTTSVRRVVLADDLHSYARVLDLDPDLFGKELAEQVHADRVHEDFLSGFEAA
jgi:hypothetical protein